MPYRGILKTWLHSEYNGLLSWYYDNIPTSLWRSYYDPKATLIHRIVDTFWWCNLFCVVREMTLYVSLFITCPTYLYIYIYIYIYIYKLVSLSFCVHTLVCLFVRVHVHAWCVRACVRACVRLYFFSMRACMCACVRTPSPRRVL